VWALIIGALVRLRIAHDVPLPPAHPLALLLVGVLQDIAILGLLAVAGLLLSRFQRFAMPSRIVFGVFVVPTTVMQIVRSEAVVFFGEVIRIEDLRGDIPIVVAAQSLTGVTLMLLLIAAATLVVALIFARRFGERALWLTLPRVVAVFVVAAITAPVVAHLVPGARLARNPVVALMAIERERMQSPNASYAVRKPSLDPVTLREFAPSSVPRRYVSADYPLAYVRGNEVDRAALRSAVRPNIIFFLMESVRAEEVGCYGADPPGVTPNLDALAREGIRVDPAYSASTYTASAELAIWYGLLPIPREVLLTSRPDVPLTGFPEILRVNGWRTLLWIHGGDSNFYRRDSFYVPRGVQIVDGRSFPSTDFTTNWGYSDRAMARNAITILDRAQEPFASMLLTLTNHHPFQLPPDADPPMQLPANRTGDRSPRIADMIQTIHYTDEALGDFIRQARKRPWFARSIIIVCGDHGVTIPPYDRPVNSQETLMQLRQRIPLVIYSPLLPHGVVVRGPASQIDLLPTLLHLAGISTTAGLGVDLFEPNAVSTRVLPMWSPHRRTLTLATPERTYRAAYQSNGPLEEDTPLETLIDPVHDPNGLHNLVSDEPQIVTRFRRLATIYATVYPWVVVRGKSGLPPVPHEVASSTAKRAGINQ
jgi:arylsulfatase A-like enzyme